MKYQFPKGEDNPKFGKNRGENNPMFGKTGKDNPNFGKKRSEETRMKMRLKKLGKNNPMAGTHCNSGETNGNWKGDKVGYTGVHYYVRQRLPKPELCQACEKVPPYDLANISGLYSRDLTDWQWLCRKCHTYSDGRIVNLLKGRMRRWLKDDPVIKHVIDKGSS